MKLNSTKLLLVGVFALAGSLSFAQTLEPNDSMQVKELNDENVSLGETLIIGKGIIDVAEDRKTPVAVSTINRATLEDKAIGNVDFPEIFTTTPSVYVSSQSSGFGESDMFLRGFSSENTAYLLNGQPINGMEDGRLFWSNWSSMTEVADNVQIQRGLGSSKLAISSVGGTVNMITKATQKKQGGYVRYNVGNDSYMSSTIAYNTGMKGKWGASFLFNHWQAHRAFAQGTNGEGQTYFVSVGYKPNARHQINFMIFGAPQQHGQNFATKSLEQWENGAQFGRKYNTTYGYLNGKGRNLRTNYYHKPVMNLNWDWTINENANLSTVLYASTGTGGGTAGVGTSMRTLRNGLIDFDLIQSNNLSTEGGIGNQNSNGAIRSSVNNHFWYGAVTNFNYDTKTGWNFNLGTDFRFYKGDHFQQMTDLFGLNGWSQQRPDGQTVVVTETFNTSPWGALFNSAKRNQRVNRDNREDINYQGVFGQVEYANDIFSIYGQGAISNQYYRKFDTWNYGGVEQASPRVNKTGWNVKGGVSLFINKENSIFANAGRYSRQPYLRNVVAPNSVNLREPEVKNEEITSYEFGYQYKTRNLKVNINAYHTQWANRFLAVSGQIAPNPEEPNIIRPITTYYTNISQVHKGVEIDFDAKISNVFSLYGFASYGDWKYDGNTPYESEFTDDNTFFERGNVDLKGTYIGEAAQFTFGMGTKINFAKRLYWDVDFMFNARIWGQVNPTEVVESSRNGETYQAERIPGFARVNTGLAYEFKFGKQSIKLRGNVRNLFNEQYLNMIDRNGYGYAVGRTWNAGVTYNF